MKHNFFPFIKYSKDKLTKKIDNTKPPSLRARVPCYNGRWDIEIYDTKAERIFPCENDSLTPMDFVPKLSNVACVIQCGGLWFGGKGWGITWRVKQIVVKPREVVSIFGKCHVNLSTEDIETMEKAPVVSETTDDNNVNSLQVEDSDEEEDEEVEEEEPAPAPEPVKKKKTIKKSAKEEEVAVSVPEDVEIQVPKKKTVKKKAVAAA